jgi:hypothetical protein
MLDDSTYQGKRVFQRKYKKGIINASRLNLLGKKAFQRIKRDN